MKKTLIIGASTNPERYAFKAAEKLVKFGHEIVNIGIKKGLLAGVEIRPMEQIQKDIHTITLYISKVRQKAYYDYIIETHPKRIIFNPGTENQELAERAEDAGIETIEACTLVLLSIHQY